MGEPQRQQLGIEAEPLGIRIRDGREVFEANKGCSSSINDEFTSIGGADADHQDDINIDILLQEPGALVFRRSCERHNVCAIKHFAEIRPASERGRAYNIPKMWPVGIYDVVVPIRLENFAVGLKIALVGGDTVGAIENCKKVWQEVDQHSTGNDLREGDAEPVTRTGAPREGALDAE